MKYFLFWVLFFILISCGFQHKNPIKHKKYEVQLSNWVGSEYYECDTVIWLNENKFMLKNDVDSLPFIIVIVPKDVVVRITHKK